MKVTTTSTSSDVATLIGALGTIPIELPAENTNYSITIQNGHATESIFLEYGQAATTTDSIEIEAGGYFSTDNINIHDMHLISASNNDSVKLLIN